MPASELDLLPSPLLRRHLIEQRDCDACKVLVRDVTRAEVLGAAAPSAAALSPLGVR